MLGQTDDEPTERLELPRPGVVWFERFRFVRLLGQGGAGAVWEVHDQVVDERVALKVLPEVLRWDEDGMQRIRNEVRRTRELQHANIVRLHDLHVGPGGLAIAMELVAGKTLSQWRLGLPGGIATPRDIAVWLPGLAAALDHAHAQGVVHRDIKPANLLLTATGQIKVADFGVAAQTVETLARVSSLTASGTLVYMSPQQLWGERPEASDDIYSVGATLYELLCGEPPFLRGDLQLQVAKRDVMPINRKRQSLGITDPVPKVWEQTIAACLSKKAEERPASVGALVDALVTEGGGDREMGRRWRFARSFAFRVASLGGVMALVAALGWGRFGKFYPRATDEAMGSLSGEIRPGEGDVPPLGSGGAGAADKANTSDRRSSIDPANIGPTAAVKGALATGLFMMLPLDGNTLEWCGGNFTASAVGGEWVEDRFGNETGALALRGRARLSQNIPVNLGVNGETVLTLSFWLRVDRGSGEIVKLVPESARELALTLAVDAGRFYLHAFSHTQSVKGHIASDAVVVDGKWMHVAVVMEGNRFEVWADGQRVCESAELMPEPANPLSSFVMRWRNMGIASTGLPDIAIDDVRMWRHALGAGAVRSLAMEEYRPKQHVVWREQITWPWDSPTIYVTTADFYNDIDDWHLAVQTEFGPEAAVADWLDIAPAAGKWPSLWAEVNGIEADGIRFVTRAGEAQFSPERTYMMNRYTRTTPGYYLAHGAVGEGQLSLGSWYGRDVRILATVPSAGAYEVRAWDADELARLGTEDREQGAYRLGARPSTAEATMAGDVSRRIWLLDLNAEFARSAGLELTLPGVAQVRLCRESADGDWFFEIQTTPGAIPTRNMVTVPARPHLWAVVQHPSRIYCGLLPDAQADPTPGLEFALSDLPDEVWEPAGSVAAQARWVGDGESHGWLERRVKSVTAIQLRSANK